MQTIPTPRPRLEALYVRPLDFGWRDHRPSVCSFVEDAWAPILGPATTMLYRRLVTAAIGAQEGDNPNRVSTMLSVDDEAAFIGVMPSKVRLSVKRLVALGLLRRVSKTRTSATYLVITPVPFLSPSQLASVPDRAKRAQEWERNRQLAKAAS